MDRSTMIDELTRKLHTWNARLDEVGEKVGDAKDAVSRKVTEKNGETASLFHDKRANLRARRRDLEQRLSAAKRTAKDGSSKVAHNLEEAWGAFEDAAKDVITAARS